jgi:tetratricopeptide (TPR) repeat protein
MLQQYAKAAEYFDKILSQGEENPYYRQALFRTGEAAYIADQYETAKPLLVKFVEAYPKDRWNTHTLVYLGEIAKAQDHPEEAEHYFRSSLDLFPEGPFVNQSRYGLAWALLQQGKYEEGKTLCRKLAGQSDHPYVDEAQLMLARMQAREGRCRDALATLNIFEMDWPESPLLPEVLRLKAECLGDEGRFADALATLDRLSSQTDEDKLLRVRCLYGTGRKEQADALLDTLSQSNSQHTVDQVRLLKASLKADQKKWNEAATLLEGLLGVQYYPSTHQIVYQRDPSSSENDQDSVAGSPPPTTLDEVEFLKACSLLTVCYANLGEGSRTRAVYNSMLTRSDPGKPQHQQILDQTSRKISEVVSYGPGGGSGDIGHSDPPANSPSPGDSPTPPGGSSGGDAGGGSLVPPTSEELGSEQPPERMPFESERQALSQARYLMLANKFEQADKKLLELLYKNPPAEIGAKAALLRGQLQLEKLQNPEEAMNMSELILEFYPGQNEVAGARFLSGRYHDMLGEYHAALEDFQHLIRYYHTSYDKMDAAYYYAAWNHYAIGQVTQARDYFDRIYRDYPESEYWSHAAWFLAHWQFERGNYSQAKTLVREIIEHPPDAAILDRVLYLKGQLASVEGKWRVARTSFQKIVKHCPESAFVPEAEQAIREASRQIDSGTSVTR